MATYSKKSPLEKPRTCLSYLNTIFWNELVIDLKLVDLPTTPITITDYLRYYRKLHNLSRRQLEINAGISLNSIKKYEDKNIYPTKEVSIKLASYFKLTTKYFYDPFYEDDIDIGTILKKYRGNRPYTEVAKIVNVHAHTWRDWEENKHVITRKNYNTLKEKGII